MLAEERKHQRKLLFPPRKWFWLLLPVLAWQSASPAEAEDYERLILEDATREVQSYARRRGWVNFDYDVEPWVPGSQEQLPACAGPVAVGRASDRGEVWGRIPYVIQCSEPEWQLRARATVALVVPVVVARRNISRDDVLNRATMRLEKRDLASVYRDFVTDIRLLSGQRARRSVRSGQVISLSHAVAPLLVQRGDQILIRVEGDGVHASMTGEAMQDGSKGEGIRVRNHSSGKIITAWVVEKGVVETRF